MNSVLISALFGVPIGPEDRDWIRGHGFHGVRSDYGPGVLASLAYTRLQPLIIAASGKASGEFIINRTARICREIRDSGYLSSRLDRMPIIEPYNEPDLDPYWKTRAAFMANVIWECWQIAASFRCGIKIITPGISNLNETGLDYLEAMIRAGLPGSVGIGFHRYPADGKPTLPHDGFNSRWEEVERLVFHAGDRKLWLTETGWTAGPRKKRRKFPLCLFKRKHWLTEALIAEHAQAEFRFWARVPSLESLTWYQIGTGPNLNDPEDNYGLRRRDGSNTMLANRMPELIREVTS